MDVNTQYSTQYNIFTSNEFKGQDLRNKDSEELRAEIGIDAVNAEKLKTAREEKEPKVKEKVMMDLKDVQHFLFMLIGADIKIIESNSVSGASLDMRA